MKKYLKKTRSLATNYFFLVLKLTIAVCIIFSAYNIMFVGRILPNISVSGIDVSGLTPDEAAKRLSSRVAFPKTLIISTNSDQYEIDLSNINLHYNTEETASNAYKLARTKNFVYDTIARIDSLWVKRNLGFSIDYDASKFDETVSVLAGQIAIVPVHPSISYTNKEISIIKGQNGKDVNIDKLKSDIRSAISQANTAPLIVDTKLVDTSLTPEQEAVFKTRAEAFIDKKLELDFEFQNFVYKNTDIFPLLNPKGGYNDAAIKTKIENIASLVERPPQNPHFTFQPTGTGEPGKVSEFAPSKPGVKVDTDKTLEIIKTKLSELESGTEKLSKGEIAVDLTNADITTDKVNNLGINELIGRGTSTFHGSIASRVYNVNLAATRLNGTLVNPGEIFSFNNALGDVSKLTGYKEAYVIKDGKTVLGDGGGVCQVSTTLFRAAMDAGLPIIERRAHAYRVGYYEQDSYPGMDATVYSPTTDFKFKNDTPGHILIQAYPDTKNLSLVFEIYGTSDGRTSTVSKPVVSNITPPPEDSYVDDPTLPAGTIKQIDWKAWGAKSVFDYSVERGGQTIYQKTFVSNYRPWQSIYLRGTGPVQ